MSAARREPSPGPRPRPRATLSREGRGGGGRETKFASAEFGEVEADGSFCGYASLFGEADLSRDVVMPGAFARSLRERGAGGIRMLFQHDPAAPIGVWREIREDARGLFVRGRLTPGVGRAREVLALMRAGAIDGLSIGFRTVRGRTDSKTGVRRLIEIDLWEISIVTFPLLPAARVSSVKGVTTSAQLAAVITRAARGHASALPPPLRGRVGEGGPAVELYGVPPPRTPPHKVEGSRARCVQSRTKEKTMNLEAMPAPETKGVGEGTSALELKDAFEEFLVSFEAFKEANDGRIDEMERKLSADVVTEDKVARISAALDRQKKVLDGLVLKGRRPELGGERSRPEQSEHKAAFDAYVRSGEFSGLKRLEAKAVSSVTTPDSGYLVPPETEAEIGRRLAVVSPIRSIAGIRAVSSNTYRKPFSTTGFETGWVGETDARPETDTPTLVELEYPVMELYAMPAATAAMLDDTAIDIDQWIAGEVEQAFATQEGAAFVSGDADKKPKGFLDYTKVAEGSWAWGSIGYLITGVSGAFAASTAASDVLVDTIYTLKAGYRQNAHFVMNRKTQGAVRKLKDADGHYLWAPPATAGGRATLMNFPVAEAEDMPDIGANSYAIAFGDFSRGYLIVDRQGVRVLRDPYSQKPYVLFYTTKRVGGGVQDFDAIKLVKFGTA